MSGGRPDIFEHHDYREFLTTWVQFLKQGREGLSLRALGKSAGFSSGYLSLVLSGSRKLSKANSVKLLPLLKLSLSEKSYFQMLRTIADSPSQKERMAALKKIQRFQNYKSSNPKEFETFKYLTKWYYVAIRELVNTKNFKPDPKWIQKQLVDHVPLAEIKKTLDFLVKFDFIRVSEDGYIQPQKRVECKGGIYQLALSQFHKEMLGLATKSIEKSKAEDRNLTGYTFSIPKAAFDKVKGILHETEVQLAKLEEKEKGADTVYHVELCAFPLTGE